MARRSLKYLLNRYTLSFRNRIVVIAVGMVICLLSLVYTNRMAHDLREKEQHDVEVWAHAMEQASRDAFGGSVNDPLIKGILSNRNNIPFIITDERLNVIQSHLVPREVLDHPDRLRRQIDRFTEENQPKTVNYWWGPEHRHIIFYGKSKLLKGLYLFPYVQLGVIFSSSSSDTSPSVRRSRTNRTACGSVWRRRRRISWERLRRRCWGGSSICAASPSIRRRSRR